MERDFSTPLSPSAKRGSLSHSQALALTIRARDVAGDAIALPEFWSASGACALKGWLECLRNKIAIVCRLAEDFILVVLADISLSKALTLEYHSLLYPKDFQDLQYNNHELIHDASFLLHANQLPDVLP